MFASLNKQQAILYMRGINTEHIPFNVCVGVRVCFSFVTDRLTSNACLQTKIEISLHKLQDMCSIVCERICFEVKYEQGFSLCNLKSHYGEMGVSCWCGCADICSVQCETH